MEDYIAVLRAIDSQIERRNEQLADRTETEKAQQQYFATVVGAQGGSVFVSVGGSGAIAAVPLNNSSLPVGSVVSYFRQAGDNIGFVDAIGAIG